MAKSIVEVFADIATWTNVADELSKRGVTGTPECNDRCPMAKYILSETDSKEVSKIAVDTVATEFWDQDGLRDSIENPPNMRRFIPEFDEGEYRDLLDDPTHFDYLDDWQYDDEDDDPFDEDDVTDEEQEPLF